MDASDLLPTPIVRTAQRCSPVRAQRTEREPHMEPPELECGLELRPAPDGEIALAFEVRNPGDQPVEMRVFRPFFNFELTVQAEDGPVPVIQPPFNVRVQPETITVAPGETLRLATPIQLRFDTHVPPSGG